MSRPARIVMPPAALAALCWLACPPAGLAAAPAVPGSLQERVAAERLVFLLEYVGADYGNAVQDGAVVDPVEHDEVSAFTRIVAEQYALDGGSEQTAADLERLRALIRDRGPGTEVRALCLSLADRVAEELGGGAHLAFPPDITRGHGLYLENCAICHGSAGQGDGPAAPGMDPPPTSFRGPRMNAIRPRQIRAATRFGVDGTAMPAFEGSFSSEQFWDVSFYVMTLREDFDPEPSGPPGELSLQELANSSNEELLARLRRLRADATPGDVDAARVRTTGELASADPGAAPPAPGPGLQTALLLEDAFARVAERTFPSVVGLSFYVPDSSRSSGRRHGWTEAPRSEAAYPGYRLLRRGSGFFVSDDGTLLSCQHLLVDPETGKPAEIIDVELDGNRHVRGRVIGLEPTVNLAVLKVETPLRTPAAVLGDGEHVRVGQWAIALADPPGVERSFQPGTIAARPERDCYQEQRTSTLLQTSLRLDAASFGGPLVDIRGEVIGMTVPASSPSGIDEAAAAPAHALPIHLALTLVEALVASESRRSPWLGISVLELTPERRRSLGSVPLTGVLIDDVFDPSPASHAGVRAGDILTAMEDNRIFAVKDFQKWLYLLGIGKEISLAIFRDGETLRKRVTIEERPAAAAPR